MADSVESRESGESQWTIARIKEVVNLVAEAEKPLYERMEDDFNLIVKRLSGCLIR